MTDTIWSYRDNDWSRDRDLVGYSVEATDGSIGKIDEASTDVSGSWLVVDTGFWILGKKRLIPAGTVSGIDHDHELVIVNMSKDAIKDAPDYDADSWGDEAREAHAEHYRARVDPYDDETGRPEQHRPEESAEAQAKGDA